MIIDNDQNIPLVSYHSHTFKLIITQLEHQNESAETRLIQSSKEIIVQQIKSML